MAKKEVVYVSLVREFIDNYLKVEIGEGTPYRDENVLRLHLNHNYRHWWCSIYRQKDFHGSDKFNQYVVESHCLTMQELDQLIEDKGLTLVSERANQQYARSLV